VTDRGRGPEVNQSPRLVWRVRNPSVKRSSLGVGKRSDCVFQTQGRTIPREKVPHQFVWEPLTIQESD
jgi:hypothetical protein